MTYARKPATNYLRSAMTYSGELITNLSAQSRKVKVPTGAIGEPEEKFAAFDPPD